VTGAGGQISEILFSDQEIPDTNPLTKLKL